MLMLANEGEESTSTLDEICRRGARRLLAEMLRSIHERLAASIGLLTVRSREVEYSHFESRGDSRGNQNGYCRKLRHEILGSPSRFGWLLRWIIRRYARKLWITHLLKGAAYLPIDKKENRRRWSAGEEGNADVDTSQ